jgi:peptidylprolyl isomerase
MKTLSLAVLAAAALASTAYAQAPGETPPPPPPPTAEQIAAATAEWRTVGAEDLLVIDTSRGRILVELAPFAAPNHVERIRRLAREGLYDGLKWHRVIDWFMAQTGDPLTLRADASQYGEGQSPYPDLVGEFTFRRGPELPFVPVAEPMGAVVGFIGALPVQSQADALMARTADHKVHAWGLYCPGVAGMARGEANDSANSQFFLMRQAYPSLDKRYTVWGRVVSGLEIVRALNVGEEPSGAVASPDVMTRVRVAADLPEGERPVARVLNTRSPRFAAMAAEARQRRGADFSVCDLDLPAEVTGPQAAPAA